MPMWPTSVQGSRAPSSTLQGTVTAAASANTKGAYATMDAVLDHPCDGFMLAIMAANVETYLIDIAIGAAASETVILSNLSFNGSSNTFSLVDQAFIPLRINMGVRIAARCQSTAANASLQVNIHPVAGPFFSQFSAAKAITYGANTADSGGTTITPTAVAYTKGNYSQLSAAIEPFTSCLVCTTVDDPGNAFDNSDFRTDIALGAAASEQILINDLFHKTSTATDCMSPAFRWLPVSAAGGQRLSARGASQVTTADRIYDCTVIGFQ